MRSDSSHRLSDQEWSYPFVLYPVCSDSRSYQNLAGSSWLAQTQLSVLARSDPPAPLMFLSQVLSSDDKTLHLVQTAS